MDNKVINKDNIDSYYELINNKIDFYFDKNVSAKSLLNYFNKSYGMEKFINRENLSEIVGIERIIRDVVEDRTAMDESVKTFEQYNIESKDTFNVRFNITQQIEKIIADHYRVSLGHIESNMNNVKLQGIKSEKELYIFTKDNLREIYINISTNMCDTFISNLKLKYDPLDIEVEIDENTIDREKLMNQIYSKINGESKIIEELLYIESGDEYKGVGEIDGIFIFEKI